MKRGKYGKKKIAIVLSSLALIAVFLLLSPHILSWSIRYSQGSFFSEEFREFPVTVDPTRKMIVESDQVNSYLAEKHSLFGAAITTASTALWETFSNFATDLGDKSWYQNIASLGGRFVTITPGMRREQVAEAFGQTLLWDKNEKKEFLTASSGSDLPFFEGSFIPGKYLVAIGTSPAEAQEIVNERFEKEVLSRYGESAEEKVPLKHALVIASLIERETLSTDGMRLLSGIMWNRLFINMKLQVDATLQYAKANKSSKGPWWPDVVPSDKYIVSPYNTYMHKGLPPTPIANPSVAAILAALNPINTPCIFYFNDKKGDFHCSETYAEHVRLIDVYYGD